MKNDVIQALHEENMTLKNRITALNAQFESSHVYRKKMDEQSRRNIVAVDFIPSSVEERELKDKSINALGKIGIKIDESDIKVCHCLGKSTKTKSVLFTQKYVQNSWLKNSN